MCFMNKRLKTLPNSNVLPPFFKETYKTDINWGLLCEFVLKRKIYKWNLHGGKTTMLYLNLSGHDIFKTRFGTSPEKHCLTATPYRLFQGNLRNLHKIGT